MNSSSFIKKMTLASDTSKYFIQRLLPTCTDRSLIQLGPDLCFGLLDTYIESLGFHHIWYFNDLSLPLASAVLGMWGDVELLKPFKCEGVQEINYPSKIMHGWFMLSAKYSIFMIALLIFLREQTAVRHAALGLLPDWAVNLLKDRRWDEVRVPGTTGWFHFLSVEGLPAQATWLQTVTAITMS